MSRAFVTTDPEKRLATRGLISSWSLKSVEISPLLVDPALPLTLRLLSVPFTLPEKPNMSPEAYFPRDNLADGAKPLTKLPRPSEVKERSRILKSKTVLSMAGRPVSLPSAYPFTPLRDSVKSILSIPRSLTVPSTTAFGMSNFTDMSLRALKSSWLSIL